MKVRRAIFVAFSILAATSLLLAATACLTSLGHAFGTPQRLPVTIVECGEAGRWSLWYLTTAEEPVLKRKTEMYSWWLVGGQKVVAPAMRYVKMGDQFVIESGSGTVVQNANWPAADVIRNGQATLVIINAWSCFLIFSIYPAVVLIRGLSRHNLRERRRTDGLCVECGYNLAGNVSGVCPECGAEVPGRGFGKADG